MDKFGIVLINPQGESVILDEFESYEAAENMLRWYEAHRQFFNGSFVIKEIEYQIIFS